MKPYSIFTVFILVIVLAACASVPTRWNPPEGKTLADYNSDASDCRLQWLELTPESDTPYIVDDDYGSPLGLFMRNAYIDPQFEAECLEKKGWVRKE